MALYRDLIGHDKKTGEPVYRISRTNSLMSFYQTDAGRVCKYSQIQTDVDDEKFGYNDFSGSVLVLYSNEEHGTPIVGQPTHLRSDNTDRPTATLRTVVTNANRNIGLWNHDKAFFSLLGAGEDYYEADDTHPGSVLNTSGSKVRITGYVDTLNGYQGVIYKDRDAFYERDHSCNAYGVAKCVYSFLRDATSQTDDIILYKNFITGVQVGAYQQPTANFNIVMLDIARRAQHQTATQYTTDVAGMTAASSWWKTNCPNRQLVIITPPPLRNPLEASTDEGWDATDIARALAETERFSNFCSWLSTSWVALNPQQNSVVDMYNEFGWGTDVTDCTLVWEDTTFSHDVTDGSDVTTLYDTSSQLLTDYTDYRFFLKETYASGTLDKLNTTGLDAAQQLILGVLVPVAQPPQITNVTGSFVNGTTHCIQGMYFDASDAVYLGDNIIYGNCNTTVAQTVTSSDVTTDATAFHWFTLNKGGFATPVGRYVFVQTPEGIATTGYLLTSYKQDHNVPVEPEPLPE